MLYLDILQRLTPHFARTGSAADVVSAMSQRIPPGHCAFVVPLGERPSGNSRDVDVGNPLQETTITIGVIIGIAVINDSTGAKALTQIQERKDQVRAVLYGWKPEGHEPILLAPSQLMKFAKDGVWWLERYTTNTYLLGTN